MSNVHDLKMAASLDSVVVFGFRTLFSISCILCMDNKPTVNGDRTKLVGMNAWSQSNNFEQAALRETK